MRVLVTGGSGVVGRGALEALVAAGHTVRLLTRDAARAARAWPAEVEPYPADITDAASLPGSADGCNAILHVAGIAREHPPAQTFERVNVEGTRHVLAEARRAGIRRVVLVSSLGAERGSSAYHCSKHRAEALVHDFEGEWVILRPGNVYGPGDEVVSMLLTLVRTAAVIPVVDDGSQRFQPLWYADLGQAVRQALERGDVARRTFELAGREVVTVTELLDRLEVLTGRSPVRVPVPSFVADVGTWLAQTLALDLPVTRDVLTMLLEENVIRAPASNALVETFHLEPLELDDGLRLLADALPERTPADGVGALERKRFWSDIERSGLTAQDVIALFGRRWREIVPFDFEVEPGAPAALVEGGTLTTALPVRGTIQVRVAEVAADHVTWITLEGHPLAGLVRFRAQPLDGERVRFEIETHVRAASYLDLIGLASVGGVLQDASWCEAVQRLVERSGGSAPRGVEQDRHVLDADERRAIERWAEDLVASRQRRERAAARREARPTEDA